MITEPLYVRRGELAFEMNGTRPMLPPSLLHNLPPAPHIVVYAYITNTNVCCAFKAALLLQRKLPRPPPHPTPSLFAFPKLRPWLCLPRPWTVRTWPHPESIPTFPHIPLCLLTIPVIPPQVRVTSFVPAGRFLVCIRQDVRLDTWPMH